VFSNGSSTIVMPAMRSFPCLLREFDRNMPVCKTRQGYPPPLRGGEGEDAVADLFLVCGVPEPVRETRLAEARVFAGGEALIVHFYAVVRRAGIRDYFPRIAGCVEKLP